VLSVIQGREFLLFWQAFLGASVLNFESGIWHCGCAALGLPKPDAESTEDLSGLRVEALLTLEDTEILLARGESFGAREECES
jgi:hypothetical protein